MMRTCWHAPVLPHGDLTINETKIFRQSITEKIRVETVIGREKSIIARRSGVRSSIASLNSLQSRKFVNKGQGTTIGHK